MTEATSRPISRRTVAKGAAWTTPVILGGVAAPAYASSGTKPTISFGAACKAPGNSCNPFVKGYVFTATITNTSNKTVYLYVPPTIVVSGTTLTLAYAGYDDGGTLNTGNIAIPPNTTRTVRMNTTSTNSADQVFTFTISFTWGHTPTAGGDPDHAGTFVSATVNVPGTPPDCCKAAAATTSSTTAARSSASTSSSSSTAAASTSSAPATQAPVEPSPATTQAP